MSNWFNCKYNNPEDDAKCERCSGCNKCHNCFYNDVEYGEEYKLDICIRCDIGIE